MAMNAFIACYSYAMIYLIRSRGQMDKSDVFSFEVLNPYTQNQVSPIESLQNIYSSYYIMANDHGWMGINH